jgi:hypothetical protein
VELHGEAERGVVVVVVVVDVDVDVDVVDVVVQEKSEPALSRLRKKSE